MKLFTLLFTLLLCLPVFGQDWVELIEKEAKEIEEDVISWRRWFHQYPELSNREFNTAKKIEEHLRNLGLQVETGIAYTGVVGLLDTGKEGPTLGLRADIDALPVTERVDVPFASKVTTEYLGKESGVMHACGHDTHVAMLLGAANILTKHKDKLKGKVVFIFQPAEEGAPPGEEGGAELMIKEGLFDKYDIDAIFGQHISSKLDAGKLLYKVGGMQAAADRFVITVKGKQTHGSKPWNGVDPITVSAQIVLGLQNIISRQTDLMKDIAVISVGKIDGGVRNNIIPEEVTMTGTIRTFDIAMQKEIHERMKNTAEHIAKSAGAEAVVDIQIGYPVTYNNPELTRNMISSLFNAAGEDNVHVTVANTGAEDFSFFAQKVPGLYFRVGGKPLDVSEKDAAPHHTPDFYVEESGLITGVKAMCHLTVDYLTKVGG